MERKNITIVVAVIKNEKGEILIARRNQPDIPEEHNKWELIGGGIDFGETPEQALKREVKEEAGLDIEVVRLLPKIFTQTWYGQNPERHIIMLNYECRILGGELKAGDEEISELKFVKPEIVKDLDGLPNLYTITELLKL